MLDFEALLKKASLPEEVVPICLDGKLVRQYEELKDRVDTRQATRKAAPDDTRLGQRTDAADPEQADLDRVTATIHQNTVPFLLRAMPRDKFIELVAAHPPRETPKGGVDPRDSAMGVNTDEFVPALVKASIADPDVSTGDRWDRLRNVLTFRQLDRLALAGWLLNKEDREIPFSPSGSPSPPNSAPA